MTSYPPGYTVSVAPGNARKTGRAPASPLGHPKGKRAPSGWAEKIAEAIKARDAAKEARRGRPVGFPHAFTKR